MTYPIKIAARSLLYRKKQYVSLFLVCMVGVGVSLFSLFLVRGMLSALNMKAKLYYGGDLQFVGGQGDVNATTIHPLRQTVADVFPKGTVVSERFDFDAQTLAGLYFEGTGVRQRIIKGIDFTAERALFRQFNYVRGNAESIAGTNGILISEPIANMLCVTTGDSLTFMLYTKQGYLNTVELVVQGIFKDSSLFGMYTSYMDIACLRAAYGESPDYTNRISINMLDHELTEKETALYQERLSERLSMYPLVPDKRMFYDQVPSFSEPTYALIPLSANLQDVQVLINAMKAISSFVIIMLVVIIIAGIGSTYRVLVMKRINEIGVYMAIGMKKHLILAVLLCESLLLMASGCVAGIMLSLMLCKLAGLFSFSFIPAFDIFLTDGFLVPLPSVAYTCNLLVAVVVFTMGAVLYAVFKSIRVMPVQALAVTE